MENLVATFATTENANRAMRALQACGARVADISVLAAGEKMSMPGDRALLALRLRPGSVRPGLAKAIVGEHGGLITDDVAHSNSAMALIHELPDAHDPFKAPDAIVPDPVLAAMMEQVPMPSVEQPELTEEEARDREQSR